MMNYSEYVQEQGYEEGYEQGFKQGYEQGQRKMLETIIKIKKMYKNGAPIEKLSEKSGLSIEQIKEII